MELVIFKDGEIDSLNISQQALNDFYKLVRHSDEYKSNLSLYGNQFVDCLPKTGNIDIKYTKHLKLILNTLYTEGKLSEHDIQAGIKVLDADIISDMVKEKGFAYIANSLGKNFAKFCEEIIIHMKYLFIPTETLIIRMLDISEQFNAVNDQIMELEKHFNFTMNVIKCGNIKAIDKYLVHRNKTLLVQELICEYPNAKDKLKQINTNTNELTKEEIECIKGLGGWATQCIRNIDKEPLELMARDKEYSAYGNLELFINAYYMLSLLNILAHEEKKLKEEIEEAQRIEMGGI